MIVGRQMTFESCVILFLLLFCWLTIVKSLETIQNHWRKCIWLPLTKPSRCHPGRYCKQSNVHVSIMQGFQNTTILSQCLLTPVKQCLVITNCPCLQVIGCILIGYMAWVMATSVTVHRFLNGDMVSWLIKLIYASIINYLVLELLCDQSGLQFILLWIGWMGGRSQWVHMFSQVRLAEDSPVQW